MEKICTIICGAPCESFPKNEVEGFVIAADKGLDYAVSAGITPDLAVGDFDSAEKLVPSRTELVKFPPEKDDTDALIAAKIALQRGFTQIKFLCALGGRLDHTLANLQMIFRLKRQGIAAELLGDGERAFFLENESRLIPKFNGYLSVFAYEQTALLSEIGVKYPLQNFRIANDFPLGVSNEITADAAEITAHSGAVLVVLHSGK